MTRSSRASAVLLLASGLPASAAGLVCLGNGSGEDYRLIRIGGSADMKTTALKVVIGGEGVAAGVSQSAGAEWKTEFPKGGILTLEAPSPSLRGQAQFLLVTGKGEPAAALGYALDPVLDGGEPRGSLTFLTLATEAKALRMIQGKSGRVFGLVKQLPAAAEAQEAPPAPAVTPLPDGKPAT
jgi:hypothetical protein